MGNLPKILKRLNIKYRIGPCKNVGVGVIGVCCPYCEEHGLTKDKSFHLGIFKEGNFSCWRCNETGNLYKILNKLTGLSFEQYKSLVDNTKLHVESIEDTVKSNLRQNIRQDKIANIKIEKPEVLYDLRPNRFLEVDNWCKRRQFDIELLNSWGVKYCDRGKYAYCLIIPIYDRNNNYVGFQAADITKNAKSKYKFPAGFKANHYLYGLNKNLNNDELIIVEGVTDVWRIGEKAVGSFGKRLSAEQRTILLEHNAKIIIAWDSDAINAAQREVAWWQDLGRTVKYVRLPHGYDPDTFIRKYGMNKWKHLVKNCQTI